MPDRIRIVSSGLEETGINNRVEMRSLLNRMGLQKITNHRRTITMERKKGDPCRWIAK
jgi:hypothetical protein